MIHRTSNASNSTPSASAQSPHGRPHHGPHDAGERPGFVSASPSRPCPVCGRRKFCRLELNAGLVICYGDGEPRDRDWHQRGRHRVDKNGHTYRVFTSRTRRPRFAFDGRDTANDDAPLDYPDVSADADVLEANLTAEQAGELLHAIQVPRWAGDVLTRIGAGHISARGRRQAAWTFRERDPRTGRTVGLSCRHPSGGKSMVAGTHRALTCTEDIEKRANRAGVLVVVEGASDVIAGTAAGLPVVGRPSNVGGVAYLVALAQRLPEVQIVVVGENDGPKTNNGHWPGRAGAARTAEVLARRLGRLVWWAMPPGKFKDVREYLTARGKPDGTRRRWEKVGAELLERLRSAAVPADGKDASARAKELADALPNRKCKDCYTLALDHRERLDRHCAVDVRCDRWTCGACRWHKLGRRLLGTAGRMPEMTDADSWSDGPDAWPGDPGHLRPVGPWVLGVAIVPTKRLASLSSHGTAYVQVETAATADDFGAVCARKVGFSPIDDPPANRTKSHTSRAAGRHLALVAVPPGRSLPRGFVPVTPWEYITLMEAAGRKMPTAPAEEGGRLRPISATIELRPIKADTPPGNWSRAGKLDRPASEVREIVEESGISEAVRVQGPTVQGEPAGYSSPPLVALVLREIMARREGLRRLGKVHVVRLHHLWDKAMPRDVPDGPEVRRVLALYARTGPPVDLAEQLAEAAEHDRRTAPERERWAESRRATEAAFGDVERTLKDMRALYRTDRATHTDPLYQDLFGPPRIMHRLRTGEELAKRRATPRWRRGNETRTPSGARTLSAIRH